MDFIRSHFAKMQLWIVEHFFHHKKVPVVLYRYLFVMKKVFNYPELHFSKVTSYKIHTLGKLWYKCVPNDQWNPIYTGKKYPRQKRLCFQLTYTRHYNPRFVYFETTFWKSKTFFSWSFFQKILLLCKVSIQERFLIKSGLWWRSYGTYFTLINLGKKYPSKTIFLVARSKMTHSFKTKSTTSQSMPKSTLRSLL